MDLEVIEIEERQDKNKRNYKYIRLATPSKINGVLIPTRETAMTAMENNYLDQKEFGWDFKVGDKVRGELVTREVEEYTIDGNTVDSATVLVFPLAGQSEVNEIAIKRAFANKGFILGGAEVEEHEAEEALTA